MKNPQVECCCWFLGPNGPVRRPPIEDMPRTLKVQSSEIAFLDLRREGEGSLTTQVRRYDSSGQYVMLPLQHDGAHCQVVVGNPGQQRAITVEVASGNRLHFWRFEIADVGRYFELLGNLRDGRFSPHQDEFLVLPDAPYPSRRPRHRQLNLEEELRLAGISPDLAGKYSAAARRTARNRLVR